MKKQRSPKGNSQVKEQVPQTPEDQNSQEETFLTEMFSRLTALEKKMLAAVSSSQTRVIDKLADFEATLNFYGTKIEDVTKIVKMVELKIALMEKRLEKTEDDNKELKGKLKAIEIRLNEQEQKQCNDKIEITSQKITKNTDPHKLTEVILQTAGITPSKVDFKAQTIVKSFKVEEKVQEKASVVVQFRSNKDRNDVLSKIKLEKVFKKLDDITENGQVPIFINECLSSYNKKLLYEVNKLKKNFCYSFVWVKEGKILVKKTEGSEVNKILIMDDLVKLKA